MKKVLFVLLLALGSISSSFASRNYEVSEENVGRKGIIEFGQTFSSGDYGENRLELNASYGYKFNPNIFLGGGVGAHYYFDSEIVALPVFAQARAYMMDNNITPFVDFKIGYSFTDVKGMYLSPSIGCKINSWNVSLGYALQKSKFEIFNLKGTVNCSGVSLKVGYEF